MRRSGRGRSRVLPVVAFGARRQAARPQQGARVFERDLAGQVLDLVPPNDELTAIAVDVAQFGFGDDNTFQTGLLSGHTAPSGAD